MIQCEKDTAEFESVSSRFSSSSITKGTNTQEPNFMYVQFIKKILTRVKYSELDRKDMIDYLRCNYRHNSSIMKILDEFELKYQPEASISWYTKDTALYSLINEGLRTQNIDILYPIALLRSKSSSTACRTTWKSKGNRRRIQTLSWANDVY